MTDGWRELYETEYPRLLRALLAISGDPDAAEDAVQEAFVKAHRTGLDRLERPGAWLLVVGTRELFRSRRRRRVEDEKWVERGPADVPGTDDEILGRALARAVETQEVPETPFESSRLATRPARRGASLWQLASIAAVLV